MSSGSTHLKKITPPNAFRDLQKVLAKDGGLNASASRNFKDRIFGRDSIEAAEDLLVTHPKLVEEVILSLARLQGTKANPLTEEEVGKIHHEFFRGSVEQPGVLRYDAIDPTPLYVRLITRFVWQHGDDILFAQYTNKDGKEMLVYQSMLAALAWITDKICSSDIGLFEFQRTDPALLDKHAIYTDPFEAIIDKEGHLANHIENQIWTDSFTAIIHEDGMLANHSKPIAAIEAQALAYDALINASYLWMKEDPLSAKRWRKMAYTLRHATLDRFWMEDRQYFARAIDRDSQGQPRQVKTISSMPAEILETNFFDSFPFHRKRKYIMAILKTVLSESFITDVGLRCRAASYADLVPYADYHGSRTSWIKETYDIAKGLRRHGFYRLAEQLEVRILNAVNIAGNHYEFFYVEPNGEVSFIPQETPEGIAQEVSTIIGTNLPEQHQTWTISAVLAIRHRRGDERANRAQDPTSSRYDLFKTIKMRAMVSILTIKQNVKKGQNALSWQYKLENLLLKQIPTAQIVQKKRDLRYRRILSKQYHIDIQKGLELERSQYRKG